LSDPITFLNARLDEAQQRAEAMGHFVNAEDEFYSCPAARTEPLGDLEWGEEHCNCGLAERKAKRLREVEADRKLIAAYQAARADVPPADDWYEVADGVKVSFADGLESALKIRAGRFSDNPDYDQGWTS
jgi:Family of unknown function (DUF6221)